MTERESIANALSLLLSGDIDRARAELEQALARHEQRRTMRREREKLIEDYCLRYNMTAREARALLAVERPEFNWQQH